MSDQPTGNLSDRIAQTQIHRLKQALQSAEQAIATKTPVDAALRQYMARNRSLGSRDRRLIRDTLFSYYRWKPWLSIIAEEKNQPDAAIYLAGLLGNATAPSAIIALGEELGIPPSEVPENLTASSVKEFLQGFTQTELLEAQLFPDWFSSALPENLQSEPADSWLTRPPTWIRTLESKSDQVLDTFKKRNLAEPEAHPDLPCTFQTHGNFAEQSLIKATGGGFLIQDIASQVVVDLCRSLPVSRWWDACCGTGGKTLALADGGQRQIFASDSRSSVTRKLHERRRQYADLNIKITSLDATQVIPNDGPYEGVLLDAPCSGQGTWGRNPDLKWRTDEQDLNLRVAEQTALLKNCALAVAPSGYLVYSVCSLTQVETSDIIKAFLLEHPNFQPLGVPHPLLPKDRDLHSLGDGGWENGTFILPSTGPGNGMYISILQNTNEK